MNETVTAFLLATLAASGVFTVKASCQAFPTAYKTMDISAFGGYSSTTSDVYTRTRPTGFVFGADVTRYFKGPIVPSLEARVNLTGTSAAAERTYLIGFRAEPKTFLDLPRVHPYVDLLGGRGTVHFNHPADGYLGDNSVVFSYGGGIDFDLAKNVSLKLDYQKQHWNTGEVSTNPGTLTFGVSYRFPFQPSWKRGKTKDK